jgi:hypothetical protein
LSEHLRLNAALANRIETEFQFIG